MPSSPQCTNPIGERPALAIKSLHVDAGTLDQQSPDILVSPLTDPEKGGLSTSAVLARYQADRRSKVTTAPVLLAVAHFSGQYARGDRTYTGNRQETLAEVVVVELADQLPFNRADLFAEVLEVRMQVLEDRDQTRWQRVFGQHG